MTEIQDGGHSPIVVRLKPAAVRIDWRIPRPRPPEVLLASEKELQGDGEFAKVVEKWKGTEEFRGLRSAKDGTLCPTVFAALEKLVEVAGGREVRAKKPRRAFDSRKALDLRQDINALNAAEVELERWGRSAGSGSSRTVVLTTTPFEVDASLRRLSERGMNFARGDREALRVGIRKLRDEKVGLLKGEMQQMRYQRMKRWKDALPRVWRTSPGTIFGWLKDESVSWGQVPLMGPDGEQLTTVASVDAAVKDFWVEKVWRKEKVDEAERSWETFLASEFAASVPNLGKEWPEPKWNGGLVKEVLRLMKKKAAPGMVGLPVDVAGTP